jgi:spore maturation protein CgeB
MKIAILGLSITSSWGNGHATTFRGLVRELAARGHEVVFLERDVPWYADNRDLPEPPYCRTILYSGLEELRDSYQAEVSDADFVLVGSYVPDGVEVGRWVCEVAKGGTGFYDIDTPVTLAKLERGDFEYLHPDLIPRYGVYMSFTGGPTLNRLEREFGSPKAEPLYCSFDPELYFPEECEARWDFGYMGTYSDDRQPTVDELLLKAARAWPEGQFVVAGPQYPEAIEWPPNVERIEHLPPAHHREFYNSQCYTLNVTRQDMIRAGWAPSVRLFEAAACGTPIISDYWDGLNEFFEIGKELFVASAWGEVLTCIRDTPESKRLDIAQRARQRVLQTHTAAHRAQEFERYAREAIERRLTAVK